MCKWISKGSLWVGILALVSLAASAGANDTWHRPTNITFSGPVRLPGVTLAAGTYVFELADPMRDPNLVRVWSRDRSVVYLTAFTHRIDRPRNWPENRPVSIGEAAPGTVPPVLAWFPAGESIGHQFVYRAK